MRIRPTRRALLSLAVLIVLLLAVTVQFGPSVMQPAQAGGATPLVISSDMVLGSKNLPPDQQVARGCVLTNRFPRNSQIVWRARVVDPYTGEAMDDTAISRFEIRLANGETLAMRYGTHPPRGAPDPDHFWSGSWAVPKDYPTGTLRYTLVATSVDGRTGMWEPFRVDTSQLTVTDEVFPDQ